MARFRWLILAVLMALPALGCTKECDTCSSDSDCTDGLVCSTFNDSSKRCGTGTGATTCRIRR